MTIEGLLGVIIYLVIIGLIFYVVWWALGQVALPDPINKVVRVLLVIVLMIVLIYVLLGIAGPMPRLLR